jgi:hypothetical protein
MKDGMAGGVGEGVEEVCLGRKYRRVLAAVFQSGQNFCCSCAAAMCLEEFPRNAAAVATQHRRLDLAP